jgi:hypothetical protein
MLAQNTVSYSLWTILSLIFVLTVLPKSSVAQSFGLSQSVKTNPPSEAAAPETMRQNLKGEWVANWGICGGSIESSNLFFPNRWIFGGDRVLSLINVGITPPAPQGVEDQFVELQYSLEMAGVKPKLAVYTNGSETDRISLDIEFCGDKGVRLTSQTLGKFTQSFAGGNPVVITLEKVSPNDKLLPPRRTKIIDRMDERTGYINLGVINRAQQVYQLENKRFASKVANLDALLNTQNYQFEIRTASVTQSVAVAIPRRPSLMPLISAVAITGQDFRQIICKGKQAGINIVNPTLKGNGWQCGAGSFPVEGSIF